MAKGNPHHVGKGKIEGGQFTSATGNVGTPSMSKLIKNYAKKQTTQLKPGHIVEFKHPMADEMKNGQSVRMKVVEVRGKDVLAESLDPISKGGWLKSQQQVPADALQRVGVKKENVKVPGGLEFRTPKPGEMVKIPGGLQQINPKGPRLPTNRTRENPFPRPNNPNSREAIRARKAIENVFANSRPVDAKHKENVAKNFMRKEQEQIIKLSKKNPATFGTGRPYEPPSYNSQIITKMPDKPGSHYVKMDVQTDVGVVKGVPIKVEFSD